MDAERLGQLVAGLDLGKRLPEAVYLHAAALDHVPTELRAFVEAAARAAGPTAPWNVVKLAVDAPRISLLSYPRFLDDAFPALEAATIVDLGTGQVGRRQYGDDNPPILHRKEAMLPPDHPLVPIAAALTDAAEQYGLFDETHTIGHRRAWEARLERLGLRVEGHELRGGAPLPAREDVHRHRTALTRYALSTPMQALWRHGFLDGQHSIFDYGCGRGDDLRALTGRGLDARGWDPYFAPDGERVEADVVNLGFVLNVIEDVGERDEALRRAWALTRKLLVVGVLIGGRSAYERCRLFRDGVLTARGTFQKYYTPAELRAHLEGSLGREPIALAPGIAFIFRDDAEEQAFLARRATARHPIASRPAVPRVERPASEPRVRTPRVKAPTKWDIHGELIEAFWARCVDLGRVPEPDEFDRLAELRDAVGAPGVVIRRLVKHRGSAAIDDALRARRDDLLVFLALNLFERRRSFGGLPEALRRDVKTTLGSYQAAQTEAQRLLFSAGQTPVVAAACADAAARGLGFMDGDHSLQLHTSMARDLPPVLRVYLGCAARLYGDVEDADLVKIHIQSGKLSLMNYDDFDGKPVPDLIERVKINLRRQQIDFFEYGTPTMPAQPLYLKSRYIGPTFPSYDDQLAFDRRLTATGLFDLSGFGPPRDVFVAGLARAGLMIDELQLCEVGDQSGAAAGATSSLATDG